MTVTGLQQHDIQDLCHTLVSMYDTDLVWSCYWSWMYCRWFIGVTHPRLADASKNLWKCSKCHGTWQRKMPKKLLTVSKRQTWIPWKTSCRPSWSFDKFMCKLSAACVQVANSSLISDLPPDPRYSVAYSWYNMHEALKISGFFFSFFF